METRAARVEDYDAYARLVPELAVDDPIPSRAHFSTEIVTRTLVAVDAGEVVGYAMFDVMQDVGYVRNIVSAPAHRRRGIGVALMIALHDVFAARGATSWCLNVKPTNTAAIALYERCGMRRAYRSYALRLPREVALPSPPAELTFAPVPPESDELVENTLRLLPGQLATSTCVGRWERWVVKARPSM